MTEEQIHDMFSTCANPEDGGSVKRIVMGLDRHTPGSLGLGTLFNFRSECLVVPVL